MMKPQIAALLSVLGLILLLCPLATPAAAAESRVPDEKLAVLAGLDFLELCDRGDYAGGWSQTAQLFREKTGREIWLQKIAHLRGQYGNNLQRTLQLSRPIEDQPVAGRELLFLIFSSRFAKKSVAELLTMVKENGRRWRVAGYSLQ